MFSFKFSFSFSDHFCPTFVCHFQLSTTHAFGGHLGGPYDVALVVQDVDALRQLRVTHEHHVAHVCTGWGGQRVALKTTNP